MATIHINVKSCFCTDRLEMYQAKLTQTLARRLRKRGGREETKLISKSDDISLKEVWLESGPHLLKSKAEN